MYLTTETMTVSQQLIADRLDKIRNGLDTSEWT